MTLWGYYKDFGPAWHKRVCRGAFPIVPLHLQLPITAGTDPTLYNKQLALLHGILQYPGTDYTLVSLYQTQSLPLCSCPKKPPASKTPRSVEQTLTQASVLLLDPLSAVLCLTSRLDFTSQALQVVLSPYAEELLDLPPKTPVAFRKWK